MQGLARFRAGGSTTLRVVLSDLICNTHAPKPSIMKWKRYSSIHAFSKAIVYTVLVYAGSSGGSASAVAARFAPWSLCEDTGGSCRAPAIANGIFGLRPTLGCYNYSDALVLATFTRDTVGTWKPAHNLC